MNTSYALNTYQAHDLNIAMKTSSGDIIKMDFANHNSTSLSHQQNENGLKTSMSFSSMQSFQFSMTGNGIDAQDKKEIEEFMKTAQPFIDDFLKEFEDVAPSSPVSKIAHQIASAFEPSRERDSDAINNIKTNIVKMFENSLNELRLPEALNTQELIDKIFKETQKLLQRTLKEFDEFNNKLYA